MDRGQNVMTNQKVLKNIEIKDLMNALGFHHLDSRDRWKLKLCDTLMVTDAMVREANENEELPELLTRHIEASIQSTNRLIRKKKVLLAFFK